MIVGVDVSKDKLDVYVSPQAKHWVIKNSNAGIRSFMRELNSSFGAADLIVFESTGGYEKALECYLLKNGLAYHKAHPTRVYHYGKSQGYFAKTDRIDARLLAQYGEQAAVVADEGVTEDQLKRQELSARKLQIKRMIESEKPKLKQPYLGKLIKRSVSRVIKALANELKQIEDALDAMIHQDELLREKRALLQSVKGVGKETSTLLVTDLPELGRLDREAISSLVGVAPQTKDSGRRQGYRAISRGRFDVRKGLYMAALVAVRHNPRMKAIYEKLLAKGKKKKVALVAVMRKMLIMMNAMVKHQTPWQADRI